MSIAADDVVLPARDATTPSTPLLATHGLTKTFGRLTALKQQSITVHTGEIVGVIGPNGSGKSTFFNLVTGFLRPDAGQVILDGAPIQQLAPARIARMGVVRTFQGTRLFAGLSVLENVRAAAQLRHPSSMLDAVLDTPRLRRVEAEVDATAQEMLDLVGLDRQAARRARDLPYGDQRRLELVRALATRPRLLMLDEPAAGMDATETRRLLGLISEIRHNYRLGVIVVEHDMDLIMNLCDRIQVLAAGETVFEGSPAEVQAHPRVREVYLGHA
jgi:branched-chain amino acid transport system ATP-binding protein